MVYEKYKSFWDSEVANFECSSCGKNLFDFPELIIDGKSYCFSCSKKRFSDLSIAADRENRIIDKNYEDLRAIYNRSKNNLQEEHYRYDKKKKEFVNSRINDNRIDLGSYLNAVGGLRGRELMIAVFLFWTGLILPVSIYLFLFLKPIRAIKYDLKLKPVEKEFLRNNPPPESLDKLKPPAKPILKKVTAAIFLSDKCNDAALIGVGYDRPKILSRDKHQCQNCMHFYNSTSLEIHHVLPRAQGGSDSVRNLITLCIPCHMAETWFNHYHIKAKRERIR